MIMNNMCSGALGFTIDWISDRPELFRFRSYPLAFFSPAGWLALDNSSG